MNQAEPSIGIAHNSGAELSLERRLANAWQAALAREPGAQGAWEIVDGGDWTLGQEGIRIRGTGPEWLALAWKGWDPASAREMRNFAIEVTISGTAGAAGISFGPYKDFLVGLDPQAGPRRLRLEVDVDADCWALRVDGELVGRQWWDTAVACVNDMLDGTLRLKVRYVGEVLFQDLAIRGLESSCRLSVIITCYRFLQRLRVTLRNWCHQDSLPSAAYELLIVNPDSPDGTHEYLAAVARSYPHLRVREIAVGSAVVTNKGAMINRAFQASRGEWIWLTDADCLFGTRSAAAVLEQIKRRPDHLYYGERRFLTGAQTDALLCGRLDPIHDFAELARLAVERHSENYPWGYTQIVHRSTFHRFPYNEGFNHFAHTDGMFAEECKRRGIFPKQIPDLYCLHLDHPFSWYGTNAFL